MAFALQRDRELPPPWVDGRVGSVQVRIYTDGVSIYVLDHGHTIGPEFTCQCFGGNLCGRVAVTRGDTGDTPGVGCGNNE